MKASRIVLPSLALIAGLFHFFVSTPVFETGPDALNQIAGAFNLFSGNGYTLESGEPVRYWLPIYAIYASGFLAVNRTFTSLAVGNSLLIAAVSFTWSIFILRASSMLSGAGTKAPVLTPFKFFSISSATFIAIHVLRNPSSDAAFSLVFPIFLCSLLELATSDWRVPSASSYAILSIGLVNSHNMGVMLFLAASCSFFLSFMLRRKIAHAVTLVLAAIVALPSWLAVRKYFDLEGSHEFQGLFGADRSIESTALDLILGPSDLLFFFWPAGTFILFTLIFLGIRAAAKLDGEMKDATYALLSSILLFSAFLFFIFSSTTIHSGIGGRFALVQALCVLMLSNVAVTFLRPKIHISVVLLAALPLASSATRVAKWYKEYHIDGVYQWNKSIVRSSEIFDPTTLTELRKTRCRDSFCSARAQLRD